MIINNQDLKNLIGRYIKENDTFKNIKIQSTLIYYDKKIEEQQNKLKYYSVPVKYEEAAKEEIQRLLKNDIIEEIRMTYASPSFFIEKKNKELRLVVYYRWVNNYIRDEISLIPKIFENLFRIGQNKIYSKIDLKKWFQLNSTG